ncbi:MAG: antibiotic biosynthesis monooxygenase [Candidatus Electrothrix sp. AS4_5]|nr:antibiotic biosynthesis monooxygenase [Candidatus Electrothrix gigas]
METNQLATIGMNYKVISGKEDVFEKAFNNVLAAMQGIDGHVESFLYKDINDSSSYLISSKWETEEAFKAFITSDKFRSVTNWGSENILAGRPTHTIYK